MPKAPTGRPRGRPRKVAPSNVLADTCPHCHRTLGGRVNIAPRTTVNLDIGATRLELSNALEVSTNFEVKPIDRGVYVRAVPP
jgi:hypothetical protein